MVNDSLLIAESYKSLSIAHVEKVFNRQGKQAYICPDKQWRFHKRPSCEMRFLFFVVQTFIPTNGEHLSFYVKLNAKDLTSQAMN